MRLAARVIPVITALSAIVLNPTPAISVTEPASETPSRAPSNPPVTVKLTRPAGAVAPETRVGIRCSGSRDCEGFFAEDGRPESQARIAAPVAKAWIQDALKPLSKALHGTQTASGRVWLKYEIRSPAGSAEGALREETEYRKPGSATFMAARPAREERLLELERRILSRFSRSPAR